MLVCLFALTACNQNKPADTAALINENCDFELGILQDVRDADLSGFDTIPGFGVTGYYNPEYAASENTEGGYMLDRHLSYEVTAWPDYADGGSYVTRIECTDEDVKFFGVTLASGVDEINSALGDAGFDMQKDTGVTAADVYGAAKDGIAITLTAYADGTKRLTVSAGVTNKTGIIY